MKKKIIVSLGLCLLTTPAWCGQFKDIGEDIMEGFEQQRLQRLWEDNLELLEVKPNFYVVSYL